jgi:hypothetical protein
MRDLCYLELAAHVNEATRFFDFLVRLNEGKTSAHRVLACSSTVLLLCIIFTLQDEK